MTQLFKNNDDNEKFHQIWKKVKTDLTASELLKMKGEIIGSKALGYALFDIGVFDVGFELDREFFAENYLVILEALSRPITFDSYIIIIKALLGENVSVSFSVPSPGHLIINITETALEFGLTDSDGAGVLATLIGNLGAGWATQHGTGIETLQGTGITFRKFSDYGILVNSVISPYTLEQARVVLESLITSGVFTEYNFNVSM